MESEFFGHKRQLHWRYRETSRACSRAASGGTLFLDEVADLPMAMQVKLLRAIQEKAVRAVGGQQEVAVDVRILCATWTSPPKSAPGAPPGPLLPPQRHRAARTAAARTPRRHPAARRSHPQAPGRRHRPAGRQADRRRTGELKNYRFPGNVRELENMLERAYTLCEDDQIQPHDLRLADAPGASQEGAASLSEIDNLEDYLEDIEAQADHAGASRRPAGTAPPRPSAWA